MDDEDLINPAAYWTRVFRLPKKIEGGSPPNLCKPSCPNLSFFLAFPNLEDEIPFKGGSLQHPEILECLKINKN